MQITLPKRIIDSTPLTKDFKSIVVVGANGSGKSRFGTDVEKRYSKQSHRISAQKSLTMPEQVSTTSIENAESDFLYGNPTDRNNKNIYRWGQKPDIFLLNDFQKLMVLLHTEEYEESIKFKSQYTSGQVIEKPVTKLDKIQGIWEAVLPHRKLLIKAGKVDVYPAKEPAEVYNTSAMSDGERVIFYLIGEVVCVPKDAIVIIDEPEMHIHKAVTKHLWDAIELERSDCTFIYLTHDIDFAASRQNSEKIWMKGFSKNGWDYEILNLTNELPEQLYLEILGSRQPILFIEGESTSIDYKLLPLVFSDYNVKPLGSCSRVFEITKAFNNQTAFHHIASVGLIDRDRRTNDEISHINSDIWIANVAEIENFLLLEEVVITVAKNMMKDAELIFNQVKENVISFFKDNIEQQATAHTISRIERIFNNATSHKDTNSFVDLENALNDFWSKQNFKKIYDEYEVQFNELVNTKNYEGILIVFNHKGLLPKSNIAALCDLNVKNDAYLNYVISILKQNNGSTKTIKEAIKKRINIK